MAKGEYSAGMVSKPFWFLEFKKVIRLLHDGCSYDDIKYQSVNENLFSVSKAYRAKEIYNNVTRRAKALNTDMIELFCSTDLASSKIIALISVMKTDKLFFEFLYDVYREKIILGMSELTNSDINIFFKNKQSQSETVAVWTDSTLKKLRNSYTNYLCDAGILFNDAGVKKITPPVLDITLEKYLMSHNMEQYVYALTGVK